MGIRCWRECEEDGGHGRGRAGARGGGGGAKKLPRGLGPPGVRNLEQLDARAKEQWAATAAKVTAAEQSQREKSQRPASRRAARKSQRLGEPPASANTGTLYDHGRRLISRDCRVQSKSPTDSVSYNFLLFLHLLLC